MRGLRHEIDARQLTDHYRDSYYGRRTTLINEPYIIKRKYIQNKTKQNSKNALSMSSMKTMANERPRQMIDVWDYIDQRVLQRYNITHHTPRVKLKARASLSYEDETEIPVHQRSDAITYLHSFPVYYLPYLHPQTEAISIENYIYVSIYIYLLILNNFNFLPLIISATVHYENLNAQIHTNIFGCRELSIFSERNNIPDVC